MNDIPIVENLVRVNIFLYNIDIVNGAWIGKLVIRSVGKLSNTARLLRYNSHKCYISNSNFFTAYPCTSSDQFNIKAGNLEKRSTTCSERVKHVYPKNMYQFCETLFDKFDSFGFPYTDNQKFFNNMVIFDFESICLLHEIFRDTETTTSIGKHIPNSLSTMCNLKQ